jgi:osmoprotectant transport system ATP-binding protein
VLLDSCKSDAVSILDEIALKTPGRSGIMRTVGMDASPIAFRHVFFTHRGTQVLTNLDLDIAAGEVVALVGRSGAGKTSALKLVNRLAVPDSGDVVVAGRATRDWDAIELRRSIGYVIQETGLFPHFTVAANVSVVPRLLGWPDTRIRPRVAELLDLIGLSPDRYASRWPDELSGGERQRVGVARALAVDPPVLLMDEPFGALDPITRSELQREFRRIQEQIRKTVLLVTHDIGEALRLADRVAVLDRGTIAAFERPAELVRNTDPRVRPLLEAAMMPALS